MRFWWWFNWSTFTLTTPLNSSLFKSVLFYFIPFMTANNNLKIRRNANDECSCSTCTSEHIRKWHSYSLALIERRATTTNVQLNFYIAWNWQSRCNANDTVLPCHHHNSIYCVRRLIESNEWTNNNNKNTNTNIT